MSVAETVAAPIAAPAAAAGKAVAKITGSSAAGKATKYAAMYLAAGVLVEIAIAVRDRIVYKNSAISPFQELSSAYSVGPVALAKKLAMWPMDLPRLVASTKA